MKIAIFTDSFYPQVNGVVTFVVSLAKGLAEKKHNILIIAPKSKKIKQLNLGENITLFLVPSFDAFFYKDFRFTFPYMKKTLIIKKFKPDIIHFHTPFTLGMEAIIIAKFLNIPLIGTFHTFIMEEEYRKHMKMHKFDYAKKIAWKYCSLFYNRCDLVTCPSEITKKELIKNNIKDVEVVHNFIDLKNFKMVKKKSNYIIFVGRVTYEKSIDVLIKAMKIIRKYKNIKLMIVGDGPSINDLQKLTKRLKLEKNIEFKGEISNKKIIESGILNKALLFVTASKTETFGISVLEAMASGLPIVGVNFLGLKELVKNNKNGFLTKQNPEAIAEKIILLLKNKNLRKKMGNESLKLSKKYSKEIVIKKWENIYKAISLTA